MTNCTALKADLVLYQREGDPPKKRLIADQMFEMSSEIHKGIAVLYDQRSLPVP